MGGGGLVGCRLLLRWDLGIFLEFVCVCLVDGRRGCVRDRFDRRVSLVCLFWGGGLEVCMVWYGSGGEN